MRIYYCIIYSRVVYIHISSKRRREEINVKSTPGTGNIQGGMRNIVGIGKDRGEREKGRWQGYKYENTHLCVCMCITLRVPRA